MKKGFLICFTGVDGSGKTTHAKSLVSCLVEQSYSSRYVWAACRPVLSYIFYGITWLLGYWKKTKKGAFTDPLELAPRGFRSRVGSIWRCLIFVDFQIKTLITVRLPLIFGKIVVCDRYVYDIIMELMISKLYSDRFGKLIVHTTPMPHITFLMDVPEDVADARRDCVPLDAISVRRKVYLNLAKILGFEILDTSNDFESNRQKIYNATLSRLQNRFHP